MTFYCYIYNFYNLQYHINFVLTSKIYRKLIIPEYKLKNVIES